MYGVLKFKIKKKIFFIYSLNSFILYPSTKHSGDAHVCN